MPFSALEHFRHANNFRAKVNIRIVRGRYTIKTAENADELYESLKLRHDIFYRELLGTETAHGLDIDRFDPICDHLLIVDTQENKVVGSYRIICSQFSQDFYSSQEFDIHRLVQRPGVQVELGRACIDPLYRTGTVFTLLWRGVGEYMKAVDAHVLFGCASIKTESFDEAAMIYQYFANDNRFHPDLMCPPIGEFEIPGFEKIVAKFKRPLTDTEVEHIDSVIPSLCKSYLKIGSYLGGPPGYDKDFKCMDFLTILDRDKLDQKVWEKFSGSGA